MARLAREGAVSRHELVEHDPQREDVAPRVDLLAPRLLGGHVGEGAEQGAWRLEAAVPAAPGLGVLPNRGYVLGEAEVQDLGPAGRGDDHVPRLHVAVHDPAVVGLRERVRHLADDVERLGHRETPLSLERGERPARDVLHGDEGALLPVALRLPDLVDDRDVRVVEGGGHAGLPHETRSRLRVRRLALGQHLQGDGPAQVEVLGEEHFAHRPRAELLRQAEVRNRFAQHVSRLWPLAPGAGGTTGATRPGRRSRAPSASPPCSRRPARTPACWRRRR